MEFVHFISGVVATLCGIGLFYLYSADFFKMKKMLETANVNQQEQNELQKIIRNSRNIVIYFAATFSFLTSFFIYLAINAALSSLL